MAKTKTKKLTDAELLAKVTAQVQKVNTDSNLMTEVERIQRYYDMELPRRQREGNSSYVSSDVYDGVESMKAQLLDTFTGSTDLFRFLPHTDAEALAVSCETRYVEHVVHDQNPWFDLLHDFVDDGLKCRFGTWQVYWDESYVKDEHTFKGMHLSDVDALASQEDVELEADLDDDEYEHQGREPTYSGTWTRRIDKCQVRIENVPFEEYFFDSAKKRREDGVRGRTFLRTRAKLISDGFDEDKVDLLSAVSTLQNATSKEARDGQLNNRSFADDPVQKELEQVQVWETYIELSLYGDGKAALYKVVHGDTALFTCEEVDEDPFISWAPLRRPHSQHGNSFAKPIVQTQNARTVLTRAILDHTAQTVTPRWQVKNGALPNPRELIDGRQGGIVNVRTQDAVLPLQYPNMNPHAFSVLEMLKANKEENTGISSLSQGLNKDAVSTQNSEGLIENLVTLSQVRQKIVARNLAAAIAQLYRKVRKLVIEFESRERVAEIVQDFQGVDPRYWHPERQVKVSLHIGYGEQTKEAAKHYQLWQLLTKDQDASKFVDDPRRHKLLTDGLRKNSFANFADYVMPPEELKPPGPGLEEIKLQIEKQKADAAQTQAETAQLKVQLEAQHKQAQQQMEQVLAMLKHALEVREADRQDLDVANRVDVSQRETEILEAAPVDQDGASAIVSPNS